MADCERCKELAQTVTRLEAQVKQAETDEQEATDICQKLSKSNDALQAKLAEAEQQLAFVNSERADKLQKVVIEAGLADYARMKDELTEANAIIADTTKAYERYELRVAEAKREGDDARQKQDELSAIMIAGGIQPQGIIRNVLHPRERRLRGVIEELLKTHGLITFIDDRQTIADEPCPCGACTEARHALKE